MHFFLCPSKCVLLCWTASSVAVPDCNVACSAGWQPGMCDWEGSGSWNDMGGLMQVSQVLRNHIFASVSITLPIWCIPSNHAIQGQNTHTHTYTHTHTTTTTHTHTQTGLSAVLCISYVCISVEARYVFFFLNHQQGFPRLLLDLFWCQRFSCVGVGVCV